MPGQEAKVKGDSTEYDPKAGRDPAGAALASSVFRIQERCWECPGCLLKFPQILVNLLHVMVFDRSSSILADLSTRS